MLTQVQRSGLTALRIGSHTKNGIADISTLTRLWTISALLWRISFFLATDIYKQKTCVMYSNHSVQFRRFFFYMLILMPSFWLFSVFSSYSRALLLITGLLSSIMISNGFPDSIAFAISASLLRSILLYHTL